jgi:hypothetical protein
LRIVNSATGSNTTNGKQQSQRGPNIRTVAGHQRSPAHRIKATKPKRTAL